MPRLVLSPRRSRSPRPRHARLGLVAPMAALVFGVLAPPVNAQQVTTVMQAQPVRATARLASQGIGYSVVYETPGAPGPIVQIKVVCAIGQVSATAQCPTASHDSFCPTAQIVCR